MVDNVLDNQDQVEEAKKKTSKYFAFVSKKDGTDPSIVIAKDWNQLNEEIIENNLSVHKIVKGQEIEFCTKLVLAPK